MANGIHNQDITPLDLLSFIGKRGMGALEFEPESSGIKQSEKLNMKALTELAQRIFTERTQVQISKGESITLQSLIAVGTSAGGRQPKAILAINRETGEIRSGQISGLENYEYCILKFGDAERNSAELEMTYHAMAQKAGIRVMPSRLIDIEGTKHFVTQRFDRIGNKKIHTQTLAAMYPEADSYEKLLMVCRKLRLSEATAEEVFRRMVFNIIANNTDDHNKNFTFIMDEQGKWDLSPAYDVTFIFNAGGYQPERNHCLMMQGKLSNHTLEDILTFAKENGIRRAENITNQVVEAVKQFRKIAKSYNAEGRWISIIEQSIASHLERLGFAKSAHQNRTIRLNNRTYENVHIERGYKGNFHIFATIDGKEHKIVIGKNKADYKVLEAAGESGPGEEEIGEIMGRYFAEM
jgi:serine/threonine-protein kinase HipA